MLSTLIHFPSNDHFEYMCIVGLPFSINLMSRRIKSFYSIVGQERPFNLVYLDRAFININLALEWSTGTEYTAETTS